jgi:hypothetical protein
VSVPHPVPVRVTPIPCTAPRGLSGCTTLGLPDSRLADHRAEVEAAVEQYRIQVEPLLPHLAPVLPPAVVAWAYESVVLR